MFIQYKFIDANHHVALQSCVKNHSGVTPQLLAELYGSALACVTRNSARPGTLTSHIDAGDYKIGTATDEKTGTYVQLVEMKGKTNRLLTAGQKWAVERENSVQGNISTLLW